jgi:hypothetical protein
MRDLSPAELGRLSYVVLIVRMDPFGWVSDSVHATIEEATAAARAALQFDAGRRVALARLFSIATAEITIDFTSVDNGR